MDSEDCGGRINKKAKVDTDRISNLPDHLISKILSFLPTKCAVITSILSTTWKKLWTSITSLHFENPTSKGKRFTNFVDKVFRSCDSLSIQKFSIHDQYYRNDKSHAAWTDEAIKRNVREMDIHVHKLPSSIFSCTTLTTLKVVLHFSMDQDVYSFDLPCLKVLQVHSGNYAKRLMEKLISSCPVVEDLTLSGSFGFDPENKMLMVCARTLKSLRLQLHAPLNREIAVKAPTLEYLDLSEYFIKYKIMGDFSSLVKAKVNIGDIDLGSRYNPFPRERKDLPYGFTLPLLENLKCLEVITCHHLFWAMLPKLIRISPSLEVLSIKQCGDKMPPDEYTWIGPKRVPKGVRFHLSTIEIEGFKGRKHELELLSYFLGNAEVLQKLIVNSQGLNCEEEQQFSVKLEKISRTSSGCKIHFKGGKILDGLNF